MRPQRWSESSPPEPWERANAGGVGPPRRFHTGRPSRWGQTPPPCNVMLHRCGRSETTTSAPAQLIYKSRLDLCPFSGGDCLADYAKEVLVDTQWVEDHLGDESIRIVEVDE